MIDPAENSVRRGGRVQYVRPKTFNVLMHLVANRGRIVSKEELMEAVWPETYVTDDTLVQSIVDIRKAVGDDWRDSWFVCTVPRVGYQLVAPDESQAAAAVASAPPRRAPSRQLLLLLLLVVATGGVVLAAKAGWYLRRDVEPRSPAEPVAAALRSRGTPSALDGMTESIEAYEAYELGIKAAEGFETSDAIAHFEHAIKLDPRFAMAYARIGYTYAVKSSSPGRAAPYLARALALGDRLGARERLYVMAWQALADHDYEKAIDHFRLLVSRYPTDIEAFEGLGRLLVGEERLDEAIEVYRHGLIVDPGSKDLNNAMGSAASYLGRHAEAIEYHRRYVSLDPTSPNAHDSLGLSYQWSGDYDRALAEYETALGLSPKFEIALIHRANTFWQTGRIRGAIRDLRQYAAIVASERDRSRGHGELACIYQSVGDMARAVPLARQATQESADSVIFEILLAANSGDAATATRLVRTLPPPGASNRGARIAPRIQYFVHAQVARAEGDEARAIEYAREAVKRLPAIYLLDDYEDVLGDILAAFGRNGEAIDEYRRVLRLNAHRGRTRFKLARCLDAAGRGEAGRKEYERLVEEWKHADADVPELVAAKRRLAGALKTGAGV